MEYVSPAVICAIHFTNIIDPALHAFELIREYMRIAIEQIEIPRDDAGRIAPHAGTPFYAAGRNDMWYHSAQSLLFLRHIVQILCVKRPGIRKIGRSGRENLCISGPAHSFIPLRTIRRNINKIAF